MLHKMIAQNLKACPDEFMTSSLLPKQTSKMQNIVSLKKLYSPLAD